VLKNSPKNKFVKIAGLLSVPAAVIVAGVLVSSSSAAFTATTSNEGNSWTAGTVELTNDRATALFTSAGIVPGFSESHCITVNSTSSVPAKVKLYTADVTSTGTPTTMAQNIDVQVVKGTGSTDADCAGFTPAVEAAAFSGKLSAFAANADYSTGVGTAALAAGGSAQYKITVSLPSDAPNTLQGTTAGAKFVWEAQS
jgi:hypothetical protein